MGRRQYGKSLANGTNLYFSPTSLTLADPESDGGCPRKWHFERVKGLRPPQADWQRLGQEIHSQIEEYALTGRNVLGSHALRGMSFIPPPGDGLLVEHDIVLPVDTELRAQELEFAGDREGAERVRATAAKLELAPLRVRGIPVIGYIDLVHGRGVNYGVHDGESENSNDPDATVEVLDWKTTSRAEFIKPPEVMAKTIQMTIYGKWVTTCMPEAEHVRLSHVYFLTRGAGGARKVSLRVLPEQIDRQWQRVDRVAGLLVDVARETDSSKVDANTRACEAFGGCPHLSYCGAGKARGDGLADVFGSAGAARIRSRNEVSNPPVNMAARKSLLGGKKPSDDPAAVKASAMKIAREEIEAKYPGLPAAWDEMLELAKTPSQAKDSPHKVIGQPTLGSPVAQIVGDLQGSPVGKGGGLAGTGELGAHTVNEPQDLLEFVAQLKEELATAPAAAAAPDILPPDAPASDPALATQAPDEGEDEDEDPDAAEAAPAIAATPAAPTAAPARGRGRPKGSKNKPKTPDAGANTTAGAAPATTEAAPIAAPATSTVPAPTPAPASVPAPGIVVYVGCAPSVPHEDLWELVTDVTDELNKRAGDAQDFRSVSNDHDLAYGRWKGTVASMVRAAALAPGHYALRGPLAGDVAPVVVETLHSIVHERGGVFVQ